MQMYVQREVLPHGALLSFIKSVWNVEQLSESDPFTLTLHSRLLFLPVWSSVHFSRWRWSCLLWQVRWPGNHHWADQGSGTGSCTCKCTFKNDRVVIFRFWVMWMVRIRLYILHSGDSTVSYLFESVIGGSLKKSRAPQNTIDQTILFYCVFLLFLFLFSQTTRSIITLIKKSHTCELYRYSCEICDYKSRIKAIKGLVFISFHLR